MGLVGIKDGRSQPRSEGPEPTSHLVRLGEGARSGTSLGPVLPANPEGAVPTEEMGRLGKIMTGHLGRSRKDLRQQCAKQSI